MASGLDIAQIAGKSALVTQQSKMAVIGNNVARADEENYHRQVAHVESNYVVSNNDGYFGTGSNVSIITRNYDAALEASYRRSESQNEYAQKYADRIGEVQDLMGPEGENILNDVMHRFANTLQTMATTPESVTNRNAVLAEASNIADQFNQQYENLRKIRDLAVDNQSGSGTVGIAVTSLNGLAEQLATVNDKIGRLESNVFNDQVANDLRDDRLAIIKEMSKLADVTLEEHSDSRVSVFIGERRLVDGRAYPETEIHKISLTLPDPLTEDPHQIPSITWDDYDEPVEFSGQSGQKMGLLDGREFITERMDELYTYAETFTQIVNSVLQTGSFPPAADSAYDLDGLPGAQLFKVMKTDDTEIQPSQGAILSVVMIDPRKLAASSTSGDTGNGDNAQKLWESLNTALTDVDGDGVSDPDSPLYKESLLSYGNIFLGKIATDVSVATSRANTTESTRDMFQNSVLEISGVNMDEEMTEMLRTQRAYQAAAKLMKTVEEMLDVALSLK